MKPVPIHHINVEYIDTTPEHIRSFVDDLTGNPLATVSADEPVRYAYLRERGDRLKVLVLVVDSRGFRQKAALLHVYEYVRTHLKITDALRDSLDHDIDELQGTLGVK